ATARLLKNDFNFPVADYSNSGGILDNLRPSEGMMRLVDGLNKHASELDPTLDRKGMLTEIVEQFFNIMTERKYCGNTGRGRAIVRSMESGALEPTFTEVFFVSMLERCWESERGPRRFGFGGVQLIVLDIHFFLRIAEKFVTDSTQAAANEVCERALRAYFLQNQGQKATLKSGDWYDRRVEDLMKLVAKEFVPLLSVT
ncbi:hypothetical protein BDK51DRAFT_33016, partial [Blyttiomyces helicus]